MRVLIACEESQTVCKAFRERGHEAFSCDIQDCSGGHPEWHIKADVMEVIKLGWDMMIAFPPCTYLTCAGNKWNKPEFKERFPNRENDRKCAIDFFLRLAFSDITKIAIENPIGVMSTEYKKPTQIIHPYYFGDPERKSTCLWLKNLPRLQYYEHNDLFCTKTTVKPEIIYHASGKTDSKVHFETLKLPKEERAKLRSKTFPGIAKAMAEQWG